MLCQLFFWCVLENELKADMKRIFDVHVGLGYIKSVRCDHTNIGNAATKVHCNSLLNYVSDALGLEWDSSGANVNAQWCHFAVCQFSFFTEISNIVFLQPAGHLTNIFLEIFPLTI